MYVVPRRGPTWGWGKPRRGMGAVTSLIKRFRFADGRLRRVPLRVSEEVRGGLSPDLAELEAHGRVPPPDGSGDGLGPGTGNTAGGGGGPAPGPAPIDLMYSITFARSSSLNTPA